MPKNDLSSSSLEDIDPEVARKLIWLARRLRDELLPVLAVEHIELAKNKLAVLGYPIPENARELRIIIDVLRRASYPGRSWSCGLPYGGE